MNIRCAHCKGRHISAAAVRECAWDIEAEEAMMEDVRRAENGYVRHLENAGYDEARAEEAREASSGWWNLPIAASMWAADGRDLYA